MYDTKTVGGLVSISTSFNLHHGTPPYSKVDSFVGGMMMFLQTTCLGVHVCVGGGRGGATSIYTVWVSVGECGFVCGCIQKNYISDKI